MKFEFTKKITKDSILVTLSEEKNSYLKIENENKILSLGIGEFELIKLRKLFLIPRQIISLARSHKVKNLVIDFENFRFESISITGEELGEIVGTNLEIANYEFNKYKKEPKDRWNLIDNIIFLNTNPTIQKSILKGQIIGEYINKCRDLVNTPAGNMTPEILAEISKASVRGTKVSVKIMDVDDMKILGMGGVLGVGQGSVNEPKFIIMEYFGTTKKEAPVVLIGKGVTYDSGGINLKPSRGGSLNEMHMDMAGGSAVISTILCAEKLGIEKNIIGLIPAVENLPSGSSYKPSDILRTMSGQTIEVVDTDAEGRIILADALAYAEKYKPELVVDIATLTGGAVVALGQKATALFTDDIELEKYFRELGEKTGDYMWPLPMWDEYAEDIKGTFGDWANLGKNPSYASAIQGAVFLKQWVKNYKWVHLDIAPTMTVTEGQYMSKGASGVPIKLLIKLLEK